MGYMTWSWLTNGLVLASWGVMANSFVHFIMYYYYMQAARGIAMPRFKKMVTTVQIYQFVWSFFGSAPFLYYALPIQSPISAPGILSAVLSEWNCLGRPAFVFGSVQNAFFLFLFLDFFGRTYNGKKKNGKKNGNGKKNN